MTRRCLLKSGLVLAVVFAVLTLSVFCKDFQSLKLYRRSLFKVGSKLFPNAANVALRSGWEVNNAGKSEFCQLDFLLALHQSTKMEKHLKICRTAPDPQTRDGIRAVLLVCDIRLGIRHSQRYLGYSVKCFSRLYRGIRNRHFLHTRHRGTVLFIYFLTFARFVSNLCSLYRMNIKKLHPKDSLDFLQQPEVLFRSN